MFTPEPRNEFSMAGSVIMTFGTIIVYIGARIIGFNELKHCLYSSLKKKRASRAFVQLISALVCS